MDSTGEDNQEKTEDLQATVNCITNLEEFIKENENEQTKELGITEDHFSKPEVNIGEATIDELKVAIEHCKELILEAPEKCERRKNLVKKLVQLRLMLQDKMDDIEDVNFELILGHHLEPKKLIDLTKIQRYCEKCNGHIWGMLHTWYQCRDCGFNCHGKCLKYISRVCASVKVLESPKFILTICPEIGLSSQHYKCAECHITVFPKTPVPEPRQCDYNGLYYCPNCHWNSLAVIPSRVLHNWDFEPRKVCRASKQFIRLMERKPVILVSDINPLLFNFVEELSLAKKLRADIMTMKQYFLSCKDALATRLLLHLADRQHFVEGCEYYSLQDLIDIQSGFLIEYLERVHSIFAKHIKEECQVCRGKGFICELCDSDQVIFSFDQAATLCNSCSTVLHTECYFSKGRQCPKCQRLQRKALNPALENN